ncbi:M20 metallopeptidase family protein [Paenibacillus thalictri]|uniref:Amidohydrolase n=1 Tax=Paenibacillus thalictri TaxID=2527873 RepID=A0A4Q9DSR8_9BACL|nr:M20 family metallopeptidase [Paenibacillus thalictri]TBL78309.1 amidohydrolase [Paenibacillus thalictri]
MAAIEETVDRLYTQMVEWRRYLHQHPELSFHEAETAAFIAKQLDALGISVRTGVGGHGVLGYLQGGKPGPTVALRADIDALPIQDEKACSYASRTSGVMHACGHDAHTATLFGAAAALAEHRDELEGNVVFLFQPAEEISPGGAVPMIQDGALDGVDAIYGVHLWTPFPVGKIASKAGPLMAAADEFIIDVKGKGGHGGLPHQTVDSIIVASHLVVNLQTIVSRSADPTEACVVSVGSLHGGTSFNVIAETTRIIGTVRTFNEDLRRQVKERLEQISAHTGAMFGATCTVDYKWGYPPVVNDPAEAERFFRVGAAVLGDDAVFESPLIMAGEDFAYYLRERPGCFMFVGAGNPQTEAVYPHHHPKFDIDENAMRGSAKLLISMALDYMKHSGKC